jgi:hypothetical protein
VVDSKHNSSKVSFQVIENEIVREDTIRWKTPTSKLIMRKAPILGSEAKERGWKDTQNCLRARRALKNDLVRWKAVLYTLKNAWALVEWWKQASWLLKDICRGTCPILEKMYSRRYIYNIRLYRYYI